MTGRIVNQETVNELQGVFFTNDTFFNFVQDINDVYFLILSEQDEEEISITDYSYLLEIPLSEFVPKPMPLPTL